jgi:hypothetical protein
MILHSPSKQNKGFVALLLVGIVAVAALGLAGYEWYSNHNQKLGAVVTDTQLTDTLGTFRTNTNTNIDNINAELNGVSTTIGTYGNLVTLNSPLASIYGGTGLSAAPSANQFLSASGTSPAWKTITWGSGLNSTTTATSVQISTQGIDTTANYNWTGLHTFTSLTSASTTLNGTTTFANTPFGTTNIWGVGNDGSSTLNTSSTLTRDYYYTNLTISSGTVLNTANYRLFVSGTLTVNTNGTIADNGNTGGAGNTGLQGVAPNSAAGGLGATATATGTLPSNAPGGAGGAGGNGANTPGGCGGGSGGGGGASGGNMGIYAHNIVIQIGGIIEALGGPGGIGGNGVTAGCGIASGAGNGYQATTTVTSFADSRGVSGNATSSQAGGAGTQSGGAYTPAGVATTSKVLPYNVVDAIGDIDYSTLSIVMGSAGTSGGPGGGGSANVTGSGGGSGGNGGSGGVIVLVHSSLTNSGTISVAGGSPGAIGTGAGTAATLGATGLTGKIYQLSL